MQIIFMFKEIDNNKIWNQITLQFGKGSKDIEIS
jgi:hypothetical protein